MLSFFVIIFFVLGLIIGSFLNVVVLRLNTSRSLGGRSACMSCLHTLSWYELVPLFSYLGLRGRCKICRTKISLQYPLVEFMTGLVFALLFYKFNTLFFSPNSILLFVKYYAYYAGMFSLLIVISVYDLKHKIIPDTLVFIFGLLAFLGMFIFFYPNIWNFLSGIFIALPFVLLWLVSGGRWMGLGDGKLALGLGWFLGISRAISAVTLGFWGGAIIGIGLIAWSKLAKNDKHYGMKTEIPFAVYLALGAFVAFIFNLNLFGL